MSSVLVGMFDTRAAAEQARTRLIAAGFKPGEITANADGGTTTPTATAAPAQHEGMFSGFFHSIFGSDDAADEHSGTYKEALNRGGYGLTVSASNDADIDRASGILDDCGAFDVDERSQQWTSEGWTGARAAGITTADKSTQATTLDSTTGKTLNLVEESLAVGKRTVGRGGVRVFSRVVEVPVQESVHLRSEQADVQRRVVDRPATEADFAAFKEGSIEVRSSAEEAVVSKTARVVGEVEIGKKVTERDEVVRDTVRKTEVDVEQLDDGKTVSASGTAAPYERTDSVRTDSVRPDATRVGSANLDPLTGEPGAHPVGTGVGAVAGGLAAGAAAGTVVGPVGTVIGAAVGAVAGGLAGKGVAETVDPTSDKMR